MRFSRRAGRSHRPPEAVVAALLPHTKERVLAWCTDARTAEVIVIGTRSVTAVTVDTSGAARVRLRRKWHKVDAGSFDAVSSTLTVTWVDDQPRERWALDVSDPSAATVVVCFRERVRASVVLAEAVDLGHGRTARVVIRKDLANGNLKAQELLDAGVDRDAPGVAQRLDAAMAGLQEQVGMR